MTTVLIILAVIALGFIVYKLEKKPKELNLPEAPEKIEPLEVVVQNTKSKAAPKVVKKSPAVKKAGTTAVKKTPKKL
jgi:hypothetical protein